MKTNTLAIAIAFVMATNAFVYGEKMKVEFLENER